MGGGSGGGSSSGVSNQTNYIRYAPYIETRHTNFLATVASQRDLIIGDSPFSEFSDIDLDDAFLGAGVAITNFAALFDLHKNLMQDVTTESLFNSIFSSTMSESTVKDLVSSHSAILDDEIEAYSLPRLTTGARDINSVMSSTFVIAKANLESAKLKQVSKFSSELKYRLIQVAANRWQTKLEWNKNVVMTYAELMKLYFSGKMDTTAQNFSMAAKNKLWPFTVLEHERAALGAMQGATTSHSEVSGSDGVSGMQKAIGGALSGAATGAMVGGHVGAGFGAGLGALLGFI